VSNKILIRKKGGKNQGYIHVLAYRLGLGLSTYSNDRIREKLANQYHPVVGLEPTGIYALEDCRIDIISSK
jgi:hypothetical protein